MQPELVNKVSDLASQVTKLLCVLNERKDGLSKASSRASLLIPAATNSSLDGLNPVVRCSSHNALIMKKSSFENRISQLSESCKSDAESSLNLGPLSQIHEVALSKEEQMRRRDQKAFEKSAEVGMGAVPHRPRKGERYWSEEEHERFIEAVRKFGKNWSLITRHVGSRSR